MLNLPIYMEKILFQGVYKKSQTHLYPKTSLSYGPRWRLRKIKKDPVSSSPGNFSSIILLRPSKLFLMLIGILLLQISLVSFDADFVIASPFFKKEALSHIPLRKKDVFIRRLRIKTVISRFKLDGLNQ